MESSANGTAQRGAPGNPARLLRNAPVVREEQKLKDEQGQMIPMAGERFGPYEILGTLGRGGVGEVYRAWDGRLEREVAIKLLHEEYPQPAARERFLIEGRAASALNHPNICTVFDMGEKDGAPYLVMELLKGETLKHRIERGGMAAEEIAQFGIEIADALGAAHAVGIVHRDVKPANIMLVRHPEGRIRVKVLDFGLAKIKGTLPSGIAHDEHLTIPGEAVGTVAYMSPEQARGNELDGRSDLFSLGTVMYEMATRRTPFQGSTTPLLFVQLLNENPEPIRDWNEEVPRALEKVIFRLLEKDPANRFQSAQEVIAALSAAIGRPGGARKRKAPPPVPLVRVEEPVARAGLPVRREIRREAGSSGREQRDGTPGGMRYQTPAVIVRRVTSDADGAIRPVRLVRAAEQPPVEHEVRGAEWSQREKLSTDAHPSGAVTEAADKRESDGADEAQNAAQYGELAANTPKPRFASELVEERERARERLFAQTPRAVEERHPTQPEPEPALVLNQGFGPQAAVQVGPGAGEVHHEPEMLVEACGQEPRGAEHRADEPVIQELPEAIAAFAAPSESEGPPKILRPAFAVPPVELARAPLQVESGELGAIEEPWAADEVRPGQRARRRRRLLWGAVAAGVVVAAGLGVSRYEMGGRAAVLAPGQYVAVAGIENHTGAEILDGSPAAALEFALAQDQQTPLVDEASFAGSLRGLSPDGRPVDVGIARQAALAAGADAYLYGEVAEAQDGVHGSGAGYRLSVVLRDTHTDRELARAEAKADRMDDLTGAIDRVAVSLLDAMHGTRVSGYVPVAREGSANLGALHLYAAGVQAEAEGRPEAALRAYSSAASNDPGFVQALLRISWLARAENATGASADAAERASAAAEGHSTRTLLMAKATADANSTGDQDDAVSSATELLRANGKDEAARLLLARAERLEGNFADAATTAQQGIVESPRNGAMYAESELALVGLNRATAAAAQMDSAAAAGLSRPAFRDMVDYLAGKPDEADAGVWTGATNEPGALAERAAFLDNTGDLSDAEGSWSRAADSVRGESGLSGAANALLARAALNRALTGDCNRAIVLAGSAGIDQTKDPDAALRAGVAAGLCGDEDLAHTAEAVLSNARNEGSLAEVRTAVALGLDDQEQASRESKDIGPDPIYLGTYLRSLVHLESEQPDAAITELQEILAHRGVVTLAGTNLYPMAQLGLARALAGAGDRNNSMEAYSRFVGLWHGANATEALKSEALQAERGVLPKLQNVVAQIAPNARRVEVGRTAPQIVDMPARAHLVALRPRPPKAPLLTGLPESWFEHPAPGQGSGLPVEPSPSAAGARQKNMD